MKHWTFKRWASFWVHVSFVTVPFVAASGSALILWHDLFQSWYAAVPMVLSIDVLALAGLVLYLTGIESPFARLRHLLPVVSVVPLARELYLLLAHNGTYIAVSVTALVIGLFTWIAWQCFITIERLFVSPVEAIQERTRATLADLETTLAQLDTARNTINGFLTVYQPTTPRLIAPRVAPALKPADSVSAAVKVPDTDMTPPDDTSRTARVKALAQEHGVSLSTAWRKVKNNEWQV